MSGKRLENLDDSQNSARKRRPRPAVTLEARENQLIALAIDQVEKQLRQGTAPPSVLAHYLKMSSTRERYEQRIKEKELELMEAKTEALRSQKHMEEVYENAIKAMKRYSGGGEDEDEEYY